MLGITEGACAPSPTRLGGLYVDIVHDGEPATRRRPVGGRLLVALVLLGLLGGATALVLLRAASPPPMRIILAADRLTHTAAQPYCDQRHGFCITQPTPGDYEALVLLDTHPVFRAEGCALTWQAHLVAGVVNGVPDRPTDPGLFVSGCSGAKFNIAGHRVFPPAARQMDRLPLAVRADGSVVVSLAPVLPGPPLGALAAPATSP